MPDPDHQVSPGTDGVPPPVVNTTRARAGVTLGVMRYVLHISLVLVIVALVVAYFVVV